MKGAYGFDNKNISDESARGSSNILNDDPNNNPAIIS